MFLRIFDLKIPTIYVNKKHNIRRQLGNVIKRIRTMELPVGSERFVGSVQDRYFIIVILCIIYERIVRGDFIFNFKQFRKR